MSGSAQGILLVEDDVWLAELYGDALGAAGYQVHHAATAEAALALLDTLPKVGLIILDMYLPSHNGIELLHELASYNDLQAIPVFILSAVHQRDFAMEKQRWQHYGVVEYLYKPQTKPAQLVVAVKKQFAKTAEPISS